MTTIVSYRFSETGAWGYFYYAGRTPVGGTDCQLSTKSTVTITGDGLLWYSSFGILTDLMPGISRRVNDNLSGKELYRIIFWRPGLYEISSRTERGDWALNVEERDGMYLFGAPGKPVAAITERTEEANWIPPSRMQLKPAFRTNFFEEEDNTVFRMMVLSFPALKMI